MIEAGRVTVNGKTADMGQRLLGTETVTVDGKRVGGKDAPVFLAVYKPRGIVCTTTDQDRAENIVDFLHYPKRVYPVGRLDKDSEGLILMTNQGDVVNKILRAGNRHEKEYAVAVNRPVTEDFLDKMRAGVWIEELGVLTRPCRAWQTGPHTFHIVLTQGLNRQIRRMCRALDYHVMNLKRMRIMNIKLGTLKRGEYRELAGEELEELFHMLQDSTNLPMSQAQAAAAPERPSRVATPGTEASFPSRRLLPQSNTAPRTVSQAAPKSWRQESQTAASPERKSYRPSQAVAESPQSVTAPRTVGQAAPKSWSRAPHSAASPEKKPYRPGQAAESPRPAPQPHKRSGDDSARGGKARAGSSRKAVDSRKGASGPTARNASYPARKPADS